MTGDPVELAGVKVGGVMGDIGNGVVGGKQSRLPLLLSLVSSPFIFDAPRTREDGDILSSGKRTLVSITKLLLRIFAGLSSSGTLNGRWSDMTSEHEPVRRREVCLGVASESGGDASD